MTQVGALLERSGLIVTTIVISLPIMTAVMLSVEILYFIYDVNRARIPWFGFAYFPVVLVFTPPCTYAMLKIIDREMKLRRQLERRTRDFERADRTKSEFLASMSHELRTPLNAILGYSEVIRDQALGSDRQDTYRKYADDIHRSGQHLLSLINDLLDISKIEAGRIALAQESVKVRDLIESCLTLVGHGLKEKGIIVRNDLSDSQLRLNVDRRAVSQVIVNVLSNAARHNDQCTIHIQGRRTASYIELEIADDGAGIPAGRLESIFEPFTNGAAVRAVNDGAGLGLPICKRLMTALGGDFQLSSKVGEGTSATLIFPHS